MPKRKWTAEQRRAASERAKARFAVAEAAAAEAARERIEARLAATVAVDKENATILTSFKDQEDQEDDVLSQLIATLGKARDKKEKQSKVLEELGAILDRIEPTEHPELADDPTIQAFVDKIGGVRIKRAEAQGMRPGTVIGTGLASQDVPWKESDLTHPEWGCVHPDGTPQYVTFTPNETIPVWYNGIRCQFIADEEITILKCFKDVYDERKRLLKIGEAHKAYMFGRTDALPRELQTTDAAVSTARVRAFMSLGGERGGGRMSVGYPGDDTFELREVPAATENAAT